MDCDTSHIIYHPLTRCNNNKGTRGHRYQTYSTFTKDFVPLYAINNLYELCTEQLKNNSNSSVMASFIFYEVIDIGSDEYC